MLQLQHYLGSDRAAALGCVFGSSKLGRQRLAQGWDHVVHHPNGGQVPPGGVRRSPGGSPGGHTPYHADCAAYLLYRGNAPQDKPVQVLFSIAALQAVQSKQFRSAQRDCRIRFPRQGSSHRRRHGQPGNVLSLLVQSTGGHQDRPLRVQSLCSVDQVVHTLPLGSSQQGKALPAVRRGRFHAVQQQLLYLCVGAVTEDYGDILHL